jgi:hypothetical protein
MFWFIMPECRRRAKEKPLVQAMETWLGPDIVVKDNSLDVRRRISHFENHMQSSIMSHGWVKRPEKVSQTRR